jgi:hypothetical protein
VELVAGTGTIVAVLTFWFVGPTTKEPSAIELLRRARGSVMWNLTHIESRLKPAEIPFSQMSRELRLLLADIDLALLSEAQRKLSEGA